MLPCKAYAAIFLGLHSVRHSLWSQFIRKPNREKSSFCVHLSQKDLNFCFNKNLAFSNCQANSFFIQFIHSLARHAMACDCQSAMEDFLVNFPVSSLSSNWKLVNWVHRRCRRWWYPPIRQDPMAEPSLLKFSSLVFQLGAYTTEICIKLLLLTARHWVKLTRSFHKNSSTQIYQMDRSIIRMIKPIGCAW